MWVPVCVVSGLGIIIISLWLWGAKEVRGDIGGVAFLTFVGVLWLLIANKIYPWFGLSFRDDVTERENPAASMALGCAVVATAIAFATGNLGEGPSYWKNIFSAGLSTGGLFVLWFAFELGGHISISIAEERDFASGVRFGGLLLAWGLILGRAVTGDWHSCAATADDFVHEAWPVVFIWLLALIVERLVKPSRIRPFPSWIGAGVVPALIYLTMAVLWVMHLGRWEGMPR